MSPSIGSRSVKTSGQPARTSAHSTGLSSRKMKLSSPKVQLLRQRADVLRLGLPVDPPGDQMVPLQDHVRPPVKDVEHIGLVILAAQAEQEPLARQLHHEPLQGHPGRRDRNPVDSFFADHSFPQSVVAVQDDHLVRRVEEGVDLPGQDRPERGEEQGRVGDVPELVPPPVMVVGDRIQIKVVGPEQAQPGNRPSSAVIHCSTRANEGPHLPVARALRASRGRGR